MQGHIRAKWQPFWVSSEDFPLTKQEALCRDKGLGRGSCAPCTLQWIRLGTQWEIQGVACVVGAGTELTLCSALLSTPLQLCMLLKPHRLPLE